MDTCPDFYHTPSELERKSSQITTEQDTKFKSNKVYSFKKIKMLSKLIIIAT